MKDAAREKRKVWFNPEHSDSSNYTVLQRIVRKGDIDVVHYILEWFVPRFYGGRFYAMYHIFGDRQFFYGYKDDSGIRVYLILANFLQASAMSGSVDLMRDLLKYFEDRGMTDYIFKVSSVKEDGDSKDLVIRDGRKILHYGALSGNPELMKFLIEYCENHPTYFEDKDALENFIFAPDSFGFSMMHLACYQDDDVKCSLKLVKYIAELYKRYDRSEIIFTRTTAGFSRTASFLHRPTPLTIATQGKGSEPAKIVKFLCTIITDAGVIEEAMRLATESGNVGSVVRLAELGADIDNANHDGYTLLSHAVQRNHHDVAEVLMRRGACPTIKQHGYPSTMYPSVCDTLTYPIKKHMWDPFPKRLVVRFQECLINIQQQNFYTNNYFDFCTNTIPILLL